jgi:glycosyltransferase involved in cell wall biosynthesis
MQQTKVFLHPSAYEGFSTVCLEALYAGVQVISFIQPMHQPIKNWHIVHTKEEMIEVAIKLLKEDETMYEPVLPFPIDENAKRMMELFDV